MKIFILVLSFYSSSILAQVSGSVPPGPSLILTSDEQYEILEQKVTTTILDGVKSCSSQMLGLSTKDTLPEIFSRLQLSKMLSDVPAYMDLPHGCNYTAFEICLSESLQNKEESKKFFRLSESRFLQKYPYSKNSFQYFKELYLRQ